MLKLFFWARNVFALQNSMGRHPEELGKCKSTKFVFFSTPLQRFVFRLFSLALFLLLNFLLAWLLTLLGLLAGKLGVLGRFDGGPWCGGWGGWSETGASCLFPIRVAGAMAAPRGRMIIGLPCMEDTPVSFSHSTKSYS